MQSSMWNSLVCLLLQPGHYTTKLSFFISSFLSFLSFFLSEFRAVSSSYMSLHHCSVQQYICTGQELLLNVTTSISDALMYHVLTLPLHTSHQNSIPSHAICLARVLVLPDFHELVKNKVFEILASGLYQTTPQCLQFQ